MMPIGGDVFVSVAPIDLRWMSSIRLFDGTREITNEIDFPSSAAPKGATRGPLGKSFDRSLGVSAADLERLIQKLLPAREPHP